MRWVFVLAVAALGACIKLPDFMGDAGAMPQEAAPPIDDLVIVETGTTTAVRAPAAGYRIRFSEEGHRYPIGLEISGAGDLMAEALQCNEPDRAGLSIFPMYRTEVTGAPAGMLTVDVAGPGIAKITLHWTKQNTCNGTTRSATGHTTFTFFGDGHIVRFDRFADDATAPMSPCPCAGGGNWFLRSFLTLKRPTALANAEIPSNNNTRTDASAFEVCADYPPDAHVAMSLAFRLFKVESSDFPRSISFTDDLVDGGAAVASMNGFSFSHWFLAHGGSCADTLEAVKARAADAQIMIDTGVDQVMIGRGADGIFGGEVVNPQAQIGKDAKDDVTITASPSTPNIPAGEAIWLRWILGPRTKFSVTRNGAPVPFVASKPTLSDNKQMVFLILEPITDVPIRIHADP